MRLRENNLLFHEKEIVTRRKSQNIFHNYEHKNNTRLDKHRFMCFFEIHYAFFIGYRFAVYSFDTYDK